MYISHKIQVRLLLLLLLFVYMALIKFDTIFWYAYLLQHFTKLALLCAFMNYEVLCYCVGNDSLKKCALSRNLNL